MKLKENTKYKKLFLVKELDKRTSDNRKLFECQCDCGECVELSSKQIIQKGNCGGYEHKDYLDLSSEIGKQYGHLEVIGFENSAKKIMDAKAICKCDCGNTVTYNLNELHSHYHKTCGKCLHRKWDDIQSYIGTRINYMTILEDAGRGEHGDKLVTCQCDCGNIIVTNFRLVLFGEKQSCGCMTYKKPPKDILQIKEKEKENIGRKFNKLTIQDLFVGDDNKIYADCICECGNQCSILYQYVKSGNNKSCGCLIHAPSRVTHGKSNTRLYKVWLTMKRRCNDKNFKDYPDYGGRGIKVCNDWNNDFTTFEIWALANGFDENRPFQECSIDRINHNGNYELSNCRWVDLTIQANNKRNNHWIDYNGESHTIAEWSRIIGINQDTISERLRKNFPIEKVLYAGDLRRKDNGFR